MRIAIFSLIEWDFVNQRPQAFARELAGRGHEIYYFEPANLVGGVNEWFEEHCSGNINPYEAENHIFVSEGSMVPFRDMFRDIYELNDKLAPIFARRLSKYNFDFAIVLSPEYGRVLELLGIPFAYDHVDDTQFMDGIDTDGFVQAMERLKSHSLFNIYIQEPTALHDSKGFFLPNGTDTDLFFPMDRPKIFDGVVLSAIAKWFDIDSVLNSNSELLLIGPMDHDKGENKRKLFEARRPNVHWMYQLDKPTANLWLNTAHVGIVPFKMSHPVIPYAMPIKILEYFLAGLPVVTYRSEGIEKFYGDRVVYYSPGGQTDPRLDEAIDKARRNKANHREFALQFKWKTLVADLEEKIITEIKKAPPRANIPHAVSAPEGVKKDVMGTPPGHTPQVEKEDAGSSRDNNVALLQQIGKLQVQLRRRTEWAGSLDRECRERAEWAQRLEREFGERTAWALSLEKDARERTEWTRCLQGELDERTAWALSLEKDVKERAEWARRLDKELNERTESLVSLQKEFEERTAWALSLDKVAQERCERILLLEREIHDLRAQLQRLESEIEAKAAEISDLEEWERQVRMRWWYRVFGTQWWKSRSPVSNNKHPES